MPRGYCSSRSILWLSHYFVPLSSTQLDFRPVEVQKRYKTNFHQGELTIIIENNNNNNNNNWLMFFKFQSMSMLTIRSNRRTTGNSFNTYRKSYIKPPSLISPPPFRGGKWISPPPRPPSPPHPYSSLAINVDWSAMVYSGWKFILFLVFSRMTSNCMCLTFSTLRSSFLWRIVAIFLLSEKSSITPRNHQSVLEKACSRRWKF